MGLGTYRVSLVRFICDRRRVVNRKFFNNRDCTLMVALDDDTGHRDVGIVIIATPDKC